MSEIASEEIVARIARNVRYEKTLNPEIWGVNCCVSQ
jgi:hypothetical protein